MNSLIDIIYNEYSIEKYGEKREDLIKKENELLNSLSEKQKNLYFSIISTLTKNSVEHDKRLLILF